MTCSMYGLFIIITLRVQCLHLPFPQGSLWKSLLLAQNAVASLYHGRFSRSLLQVNLSLGY